MQSTQTATDIPKRDFLQLEEQFRDEVSLIYVFIIKKIPSMAEKSSLSNMARGIYLFLVPLVNASNISLKFAAYIFAVFVAAKKKRKDDKDHVSPSLLTQTNDSVPLPRFY